MQTREVKTTAEDNQIQTQEANAAPAAVTTSGAGYGYAVGQQIQLLQSGRLAPVQMQEVMLNLQRTIGNRAVVQLMSKQQQTASIHEHAASGVQGTGSKLPHHDKIQAAFGKHDISHVRSYTGLQAKTANQAIGAAAYATGNKVAFADSNPGVFTAAHEAVHIVQQQAGVQLKGGIGEAGDKYEKQADQVADLVVQGKSAEAVLDDTGITSQPLAGAAQFQRAPSVQLMDIEIIESSSISSRSLHDRLINFASDTDLGKLNKRPSLLNKVDKLIIEVLKVNLNSSRAKLILLQILEKLKEFAVTQSENPFFNKEAKKSRREHVNDLIGAIDSHVGTGTSLRNELMQQSEELRARDDVYSIRRLFSQGVTPKKGSKELKIPLNLSYEEAQEMLMKEIPKDEWKTYTNFVDEKIKTEKQYGKAGASSLNREQQSDLEYIIKPTYGVINPMLRDPTVNQPSSQTMLEGMLVLDALKQFHPVGGTEIRFATVFPGGIKDPADLEVNKDYEEKSFFFIGSERLSDEGHEMSISFRKGYYIPSSFGTNLYGQNKDQYVLPPGSKFRYEGTKGTGEKPLYIFTQVE